MLLPNIVVITFRLHALCHYTGLDIVCLAAGLGWSEATKQFATVMGLTWAASQVTKAGPRSC